MVNITYENDTVTARLSGEIDHHIAPAIRGEIDAKCESRRPKRLILDFSGVGFMDSSGIGLIMGRYRMMTPELWEEQLYDSNDDIRRAAQAHFRRT